MIVKSEAKGWQNIPEDNFKPPLGDLEVFKKIIDTFPYPVSVYTLDGTAIYGNEANFRVYKINRDAVGKFNMFNDPTVNPVMPYAEIKRVLKGKTVFIPSVKVPLEDLSPRGGSGFEIEALYMDMTFFPIMKNKRPEYIAQLHVPSRVYRGKKEVESAKEYIDNNWFEKFNLKKVVGSTGFSQAHFTRLFKQHTGTTAHAYYIHIKIGKLKEKLGDPNLSVADAFTACNLDYNGHFAKVFRTHTGLTPSEYKKARLNLK